MARTIAIIKKEMTDKYLSHDYIRTSYGINVGTSFENAFSIYSVESILFYCFAAAIWTLEVLFDKHVSEVATTIANLKPHNLKWYVNKAKLFMPGYSLVTDTDNYDTSSMTLEEVEAARVVKYAAAVESNAVVYIKVAGSDGTLPVQLDGDQEAGLVAYFKEIKDAGVKLEVVNLPADHYRLEMKIYYNPMILNSGGLHLQGGDPVRDAIRQFLRDLPFNGEYRNSSLVDALQVLEGVVMPELIKAEISPSGFEGTWQTVDGFAVPDSGYYKIYNEETELNLNFIPYETVSN
ncbi:MAG: hypothetical protein PHE56_04085 [Bacteroidales bacterium]|nr:hypothetical protein [Bacteroidales bacterium]